MRGFINTCISVALCALLVADVAAGDAAAELAPALTLARLDGAGDVSLAQLCGRVVALEFWTSDCPACVQSLTTLSDLSRQTQPDQFAAMGVNVDDDAAAAPAFLAAHPIDLPMLVDRHRRAVDALSIRGVPTAVLIDRSGRMRSRIEGFTETSRVETRLQVESLLREARPERCR